MHREPHRSVPIGAWRASVLGIAIIWAAVILASASVLSGSEYLGAILPILGGGAAGSIIVLGGAPRRSG